VRGKSLLCLKEGIAIVPPSNTTVDDSQEVLEVIPVLPGWVQGVLIGITLGLVGVFSMALWLDPYWEDGTARLMETHRQLGLPPCTFKIGTGIPCPSCGMTTSFALTVRGDLLHAAQANLVGMLMALTCLAFIPWSLACVVAKRPFFFHSLEKALTVVILLFLGLMLVRWALVVALHFWSGGPARF
jgi:hypothetical protein